MSDCSEIPLTYSFTSSTDTNCSGYKPSTTVENIRSWLRCFDIPKIRKPHLPNLNTKYKAFYKNNLLLYPFIGHNFRVGRSKT